MHPALQGAFESLFSALHCTLNLSERALQIFNLTFHIRVPHKPLNGADLRPACLNQIDVFAPNPSLAHPYLGVVGDHIFKHFRLPSWTIR